MYRLETVQYTGYERCSFDCEGQSVIAAAAAVAMTPKLVNFAVDVTISFSV